MRRPRIGEGSLGAVVGAVVGAVAIAVPLAILTRDIHALSAARTLGFIGFLVSMPLGWLIGGQIGPWLQEKLGERKGGILGGIIGGLVPIAEFAVWGWYLIQPK